MGNVNNAVNQVLDRISNRLGDIVQNTSSYLTNATTQQILFKPIRTNIVQSFEEMRTLLDKHYTVEERETIKLIENDDLNTLLDQQFNVTRANTSDSKWTSYGKQRHFCRC